jgi:hypothetical protein
MTRKEKAEELVWQYSRALQIWDLENSLIAIKCALIAVDEILNLMIKEFKWDVKHNGNIEYWKEVKQEIENL